MNHLIHDCFAIRCDAVSTLSMLELERAVLVNLSVWWGYRPARKETSECTSIQMVQDIRTFITGLPMQGVDCSSATLFVLSDIVQTNGHAFLFKNVGIAFYVFKLGHSLAYHRMFALHEVLHALHYQLTPSFAFNTTAWREHTGRQFLTEGIATILSAKFSECTIEDALWSDELTAVERKKWIRDCVSSQELLRRVVLEFFDQPAPFGLFQFVPSAPPIHNRGGYWLGATFIDMLLQDGWSSEDVLTAQYEELKALAVHWLKA